MATRGYPAALVLGAIAGMRSMLAPATLVRWLRTQPEAMGPDDLGRFVTARQSARLLDGLAMAESVMDKLPFTRARIRWTGLAGRVLSGGLCGAMSSRKAGGQPVVGAMLGASTAAAASFGSYHARRWLHLRLKVPDALLGGLEDALALYVTARLRRVTREPYNGSMSREAGVRLRGRWARDERYQA